MTDFDETKIQRHHVLAAILRYDAGETETHRARSAFLIHDNRRYPAKHILRLAFREATNTWVRSEQLTGGRASVRVLSLLGFSTEYDKPIARPNRNPIKNERREMFRLALSERWGDVFSEVMCEGVSVPDLKDRSTMDSDELNILNSIESTRGYRVTGRAAHRLKFDYFIPSVGLYLEFDERQHFTVARAVAIQAYPQSARLGFDRRRWIDLSNSIRAGDNSPIYRDEQRAFYDAIRDLRISRLGLPPVVRVFEEDATWINGSPSQSMLKVMAGIEETIAGNAPR